jgi:hypothetical protein
MFDRATCSTMTLSVIPMVDMETLIQLGRLLDCALSKKGPDVVEGGHRLEVEVTQGGAYGQTSVITCDPANDGHPRSGQWVFAHVGWFCPCFGIESRGGG